MPKKKQKPKKGAMEHLHGVRPSDGFVGRAEYKRLERDS